MFIKSDNVTVAVATGSVYMYACLLSSLLKVWERWPKRKENRDKLYEERPWCMVLSQWEEHARQTWECRQWKRRHTWTRKHTDRTRTHKASKRKPLTRFVVKTDTVGSGHKHRCMYTSMYTCTHTYMHLCIHTCIRTYMHTWAFAQTHTCEQTCIHEHSSTALQAHTYTHIYWHVYNILSKNYSCACIYTQVCIYIQMITLTRTRAQKNAFAHSNMLRHNINLGHSS